MSPKKNAYKLEYNLENLNSNRDSFSSTSSLDSLDAKMSGLDMNGNGLGATLPLESGMVHQSSKNYKSSWLVYFAVLCAQMSSVAMGCTFGWSSPALEDMANWKESPFKPEEGSSQGNWIASILTLGALVGAMFCGFLMDFFGRKKTLIGLGVPYAIGWGLMGLSKSFYPILIGRMVTGIALGITTAVLPTYVAEISTPNIRGLLGMAFNFFVVLGVVFLDVIYMFDFHWYQLALWGIAPSLALSISMLFMPESPSWCVNKISDSTQGIEQALNSLNRLRASDSDVKGELNELIEGANRMSTSKNSKLRLSFSTLTRTDVYKPMLIGALLLYFQQFCGINAVQFYMNDIFKKSSTLLSPKWSTLIANIFMLLATVVGGAIIDRFGRRLLYAVSAFGLMISIAILGVYKFQHRHDKDSTEATTTIVPIITTLASNLTTVASTVTATITTLAPNLTTIASTVTSPIPTTLAPSTGDSSSILPIIVICIFVSSFSLGVGPICWIIITEITPPQTIGLISSTSSACAWIFTFLVVNYTSNVMELITEYGTYWVFAGISFLSAVFIYFLPETKGKTMEEIVQRFKYES